MSRWGNSPFKTHRLWLPSNSPLMVITVKAEWEGVVVVFFAGGG
jgi:hypothetical protein